MSIEEIRDLIIIIYGMLGILVLILVTVIALLLYRRTMLVMNRIRAVAEKATWVAVMLQGISRAVYEVCRSSSKRGRDSGEGGKND